MLIFCLKLDISGSTKHMTINLVSFCRQFCSLLNAKNPTSLEWRIVKLCCKMSGYVRVEPAEEQSAEEEQPIDLHTKK